MSTLVINPTYQSLDILYEADLDSIRIPLQDFLNVTGLDSGNIAPGSLDASVLETQLQNVLVQSGDILKHYGLNLPTGYLWCNGDIHTVTSYPTLYNTIGVTYGGSPGVNFNTPDRRDRIAAGRDDMGGVAANRLTLAATGIAGNTIGGAGGAQTLSAHTHGPGSAAVTTNSHTHALTDPGHTHGIIRMSTTSPNVTLATTDIVLGNVGSGAPSRTNPGALMNNNAPNITYGTTGAAHVHTGGGAGASGAAGTKIQQSVVQPSIVCNYIIKI